MDDYVAEVRKLENKFAGLEIHHVIRDNNVGADLLSKLGSTRAQVPAGVFVQELHHPSIKTTEPPTTDFAPADASREVMMLDVDWRVDIINYILNEKLPTDKTEAIRITRRSKGYVLVGSKLYKRGSHSGVLMKCIPCEEGKALLDEIHSDLASTGPRLWSTPKISSVSVQSANSLANR